MDQPAPSHQTVVVQPATPGKANGFGIAGFVLSIIGLIGICIWPVSALAVLGFILSMVGVFRTPRGLAIAGLVIGLIGSIAAVIWIILFAIFGVAAIAGGAGLAAMAPRLDAMGDAIMIEQRITEYETQNQALPATLADLTNLPVANRQDFWGNDYRYLVDVEAGTYTIKSDGADGVEGTEDDIDVYPSE